MSSNTATSALQGPSMPARLPLMACVLWAAAILASSAPWLGQLSPLALAEAFIGFNPESYASVMAHFSWAPRVSMAVLIGAALGLAGAVTQQILGNPLASPTTLGVAAGSQFGVTVASLFFPGLLAWSADIPALSLIHI